MKLLVLLCLLGCAISVYATCDECQSVLKRFREATKDPVKLEKLKTVFSGLCADSSYPKECLNIVNNIDFFMNKVSPYLGSDFAICSTFHMCTSMESDNFFYLFMLRLKKLMNKDDQTCNECRTSARQLSKLINSDSTKTQMYIFMEEQICKNLKDYEQGCRNMATSTMPTILDHLHKTFHEADEFCVDFKLCSSHDDKFEKRLSKSNLNEKAMAPKYIKNVVKKLSSHKEPHELDANGCLECQILMDVALDTLKTDAIIKVGAGVVELVLCGILPEEFGCNDFVQIYGTTVVYMTFQQLDSEGICEAIKMCPNTTSAQMAVAKQSKKQQKESTCSKCQKWSNFLGYEMTKPKAKTEMIYGVQQLVCNEAPRGLYDICNIFTSGVFPAAYDTILDMIQDNSVCKMINAC